MSTAAQRAELAEMKANNGAVDVDRDSAEALFFGGEPPQPSVTKTEKTQALDAERNEAPKDMVKNVAVFLKDVSKLDETKTKLNAFFDQKNLPYQVIDWRDASGMIGQLAVLTRAMLIIALVIIFGVAVIIINNSMMMATLERIREIGTMRAIGAQRNFVLLLVMIESLMIAIASAVVGVACSALIFLYLGEHGIPANNDIAKFFFSGPRLYPELGGTHVLYGLITITIIGLVATYYPPNRNQSSTD